MKTFIHCNSIEDGIDRVRIDIDTIRVYFEYDGTMFELEDPEEDDITPPDVKCVIIKTDVGDSYFVKESLEEIDQIFKDYNDQSRFGYIGGNDHD